MPAEAFTTGNGWFNGGDPGFASSRSFEMRSAILQYPWGTFNETPPAAPAIAAAAAWNRFGNTRSLSHTTSSSVHHVRWDTAAAMGGFQVLAVANAPCQQNDECRVRLNFDRTWDQATSCSGLDMQAVLTHEFGHWFGAGHSNRRPETGRSVTSNTMRAGSSDLCARRTIEQDDVNIALHGEPWNSNISSNMGFEDSHSSDSLSNGDLHFKFLASTNGTGSATRYFHTANAWQGNRFVQFNSGTGTAASIYQDIWPEGSGVTSATPSVRVRNDGSGTGTAQLVMWELDGSPIGWVARVKNCSVTAGTGYQLCTATFAVSPQTIRLRLQVYNYAGGNLSIDNFRLVTNDT